MAGLLRYQLFLSIFVVFISLWKTSLNNTSNLQRISPFSSSTTGIIITYLPVWAILCLGVYALSSVLYKVATFEDCAEASVELGREIEVAKERLKERGFEL
jgi:dolichyl-phosphate mannosyltransferase polypeptide 3